MGRLGCNDAVDREASNDGDALVNMAVQPEVGDPIGREALAENTKVSKKYARLLADSIVVLRIGQRNCCCLIPTQH